MILHHTTGTTLGRPDSAAWLREIQRYHMHSKGWSDIGYNFAVDQYGVCWEGRGRDVIGAHCTGHNRAAIGVAYLGDGGSPTDAGKAGIALLAASLRAEARRPLPMQGHRDRAATSCPGDGLYAWMRAGMPVPDGTPQPGPQPVPPVLGPEPATAIRFLQSAFGDVPVDGIWGPDTAGSAGRHLVGWRRYTHRPTIEQGPCVLWVQHALKNTFGSLAATDGACGPDTNHWIVHFQQARGLTPDGIVGPATYKALIDAHVR